MRRILCAGAFGICLASGVATAHVSDLTGLTPSEIQSVFPDIGTMRGSRAVPPGRYGSLIARISQALGMDAMLIDAVIYRESNYRADAVSHADAIGLMQLIPTGGAADAYAHLYGRPGQPTRESLLQPEINIWLGAAYLQLLGRRYFSEFSTDVRVPLVLAAYNWGIGHMLSAAPPSMTSRGEALAWIAHHCPGETKTYVTRVLSAYDKARLAAL